MHHRYFYVHKYAEILLTVCIYQSLFLYICSLFSNCKTTLFPLSKVLSKVCWRNGNNGGLYRSIYDNLNGLNDNFVDSRHVELKMTKNCYSLLSEYIGDMTMLAVVMIKKCYEIIFSLTRNNLLKNETQNFETYTFWNVGTEGLRTAMNLNNFLSQDFLACFGQRPITLITSPFHSFTSIC